MAIRGNDADHPCRHELVEPMTAGLKSRLGFLGAEALYRVIIDVNVGEMVACWRLLCVVVP